MEMAQFQWLKSTVPTAPDIVIDALLGTGFTEKSATCACAKL
jgi:NAD(P)H-hydrate repair Nnr-like enzyme with NAD(P)H-hydrate epimerase domain